jgi:hypothetical protein
MVEGYTFEIEKPRGLKAKAQRTEGLTGMLPIDPAARIDLDRRIRIRRLRWLRRRRLRRSTAASPAQVDPKLLGVVWHGICPQTRSSTRRTQPRCLTGRAGDDGDTHRKGAADGAKACSGELVPAADGTGASTSPSSGFLTSTRSSALLHDEGGTAAEGNRQRRRRPRVVKRRRRWCLQLARV